MQNQDKNNRDFKAITVPSWLLAFKDFHSQEIADFILSSNNHSRLKCFIQGQFHEHGLFGFELNSEKAIESYKSGAKLSDPLSCYRLAEAYSHQGDVLKIEPDFEDNVYYQVMTMCFTQLFYGVQMFSCEEWFNNYLNIDPEQSTLNRIVRQKVLERTSYATQFQNEFVVQNFISLLLSMRTHNLDQTASQESIEEEKQRVQDVYDQTIEFLNQSIQLRAKDKANTQSFAYEILLYLFSSESYNQNKRGDNCLQILVQYPQFLSAAADNLFQEIELISLSQKDNSFFSHMRFVLIEIHNISKMIYNTDKEEDKQAIVQLKSTIEKSFEIIYNLKSTDKIKEQGDIIFIIRHYADVISLRNDRESIERAIQIQQEELEFKKSNEEQAAYCYYKLGSFHRRIVFNKNISKTNNSEQPLILLNGETNEVEYYEKQEEQMKKCFEKAEQLYDQRVKSINEQPISKLLSTFYLGRIHQKIKSNNNVAYRYFFKVMQMYNQHQSLLSNCRTFQFEISYLKSLKRLNNIQQSDPNLYLQNYMTLNNQTTLNSTHASNINNNLHQLTCSNTNSVAQSRQGGQNGNANISYSSDVHSINKRSNQQQLEIYQSSIYQGAKMMAPCGTLQTIGSYRAMNLMQNVKDDQNFASGLAKAFQRDTILEIPAKQIRIKSMMRKGQFGSVHTILYKDELYAAKQIQFVPKSFYDKLLEELKNNLEVVHPALFPILAVSKWFSNKEHRTPKDPINILLIMDLKKSNLEQILQENLVLSQQIAYRIASQICSGICALHESDIIHTNLKLKNILIDSNFNAYITDWGISSLFSKEIDRNLDEFTVSLAFTAPELQSASYLQERASVSSKVQLIENNSFVNGNNSNAYQGNQGNDNYNENKENVFEENIIRTSRINNYSKESDVWSFGVILLCLFFDFYPTQKSIKDINLYGGINIPNIHPQLKEMYSLVCDMLQLSPSQRIPMNKVQERFSQMSIFYDISNHYEN